MFDAIYIQKGAVKSHNILVIVQCSTYVIAIHFVLRASGVKGGGERPRIPADYDDHCESISLP